MKHPDAKRLLIASLIATPVIAGKKSSKSNKVTMSIRGIEQEMCIPLSASGSKSSKASGTSLPETSASIPDSSTAISPTAAAKSGKADRTKSSEQTEMPLPEEALSTPSYSSSKNGKIKEEGAFSKSGKGIDSKAFKGKGSEPMVESKSYKSGKASKYMSLSLSIAHTETAAPTSAPTAKPTEATVVEQPPTAKPTAGVFLFGAKTAKFAKEDEDGVNEEVAANTGTGNATETLLGSIFGKGDEDRKEMLRKKALWEWQGGHN